MDTSVGETLLSDHPALFVSDDESQTWFTFTSFLYFSLSEPSYTGPFKPLGSESHCFNFKWNLVVILGNELNFDHQVK